MSSDVVLTAALRNNLLSLQNTQSLIDQTQFKLATGRAVNSALDNPQNFFAAQSLNNRADDLNRLLDGVGQSISAIEQTDTALASLTNLVEQADSIAQQARDALASGQQEARIIGTTNLSNANELVNDITGLTQGDAVELTYVNSNGTATSYSVTLGTGAGEASTAEELVALINAETDTTAGDARVFDASINDEGGLEIAKLDGGSFEIVFNANGAFAAATDRQFANALGFGNTYGDQQTGGATAGLDEIGYTVSNQAALTTKALTDNNNSNATATRSTLLTDLRGAGDTSTALFTGDTLDNIDITINGGTAAAAGMEVIQDLATATVQDLVDGINSDSRLNKLIEASFDESTGSISIRAIDATVDTVQIIATEDAGAATGTATSVNLLAAGIGVDTISATDAMAANTAQQSIQLGSAAGDLATLETEYNNVREQIDQLVADSGYRGSNLLNGDNLTTFFNEDRSNSLTTEGAILTTAGLGISEANFGTVSSVDTALDETRSATLTVRDFNASIANDLAILQTREDFTTQTINNLTAGADKLTIADQNEEGANLLALQTRQQLGVTSLSLASQSQQAVLRLF